MQNEDVIKKEDLEHITHLVAAMPEDIISNDFLRYSMFFFYAGKMKFMGDTLKGKMPNMEKIDKQLLDVVEKAPSFLTDREYVKSILPATRVKDREEAKESKVAVEEILDLLKSFVTPAEEGKANDH